MSAEEFGKKPSTAVYYRSIGKKSLTVWVPKAMPTALKVLAAEKEIPLQDLITEFLNDGLEKYRKPRIE